MKKIIHVIVNWTHPKSGSVSKVVNNLAIASSKNNLPVEVWSITKNRTKFKYPYKIFFYKKNIFNFKKQIKKKILSLDKNCEFIFHSAFNFEFYIISKFLLKKKIEWSIISHGAYSSYLFLKNNFIIKIIYFFLIEIFIIKNSKKIFITGKTSEYKNFLFRKYKKKFSFIEWGIDKSKHKLFNKINRKLIITYFGRFDTSVKGLDLLIEAVIKIPSEQIQLNLVGYTNKDYKIKKLIKERNVDSKIKIINWTNNKKKLHEMIIKSDLTITPSRSDFFNMNALESLSLGVPIIISKEIGFYTLIKKYNCGYVINKLNSYEIYKLLKKVIIHKKKKIIFKKKKNIKKLMKENFNWKKTVFKIYNDLNKIN